MSPADVARKAKQMSFGFEAASFLKADTISYAAKTKDYLKYFRCGLLEVVNKVTLDRRIALLNLVLSLLSPAGTHPPISHPLPPIYTTHTSVHFRTFADRNKIYVSSEEERRRDKELGRVTAAIAVGVLVAPLALVGTLVLGKGGQ